MLTQKDYEVLVEFRRIAPYFGVLNEWQQDLANRGYIEPTEIRHIVMDGIAQFYDSGWQLTVKGHNALSEFERVRKENADEKAQQRFENKVSVASVVVPAITFFLGLFVEHFTGILELIFKFFSS